MNLSSLQVFLALLLLAAVFPHLRIVSWRQAVLAACNAGVLFALIPNAQSWVVLAVFILSGFTVGTVLRRAGGGNPLLVCYVTAMVLAFVIIRKYDIVTTWLPASLAQHAILVVGLSYMLFRQIHFLVDASQQQIEHMSLWVYANYQVSFLTILSGPIQRYQEYDEQWQLLGAEQRGFQNSQLALLRFLIGYTKLAVVAPMFLQAHGSFLAKLTVTSPSSAGSAVGNFFGLFYSFPIYLYLNFSGYCDIVIAAGYFLGMRLPENFDQPYLSRNVIDFWTRFHRTLGFWIRDYLFLPMYKWIAERWPRRADSLAFLCYFVAFLLAGVWHGPTSNFVIYGLLQAIGVSAAKLWERHIIKRRGRVGFREYMRSYRTRIIAILATLHFECFSLLFFPNDIVTVGRVLRSLSRALA